MKLSMSLLAKHLAKYDPEVHILKDELSIKGIRFLSDQRKNYALDYVYIGDAIGYIQDPRYQDAMILVCGENQIICHSSDSEMLINDILSAFDYYGGLEEQLIIAAAEHRPLEFMLEKAAGILDSPILVFDMEGALIQMIRAEQLPEQIWKSVHEHRTADFESMSQILIDDQGKIWKDITDQPLLLHPVHQTSEKAVSMYLSLEEERVGFVMIFPISKNEERLSLHCEQMLANYFCKAGEFTNHASVYLTNHQIFKQLLSGEQVAQVMLKKFYAEITSEPDFLLLTLQSQGIYNYTVHQLLINEVNALGLKCITCEYQNTVVILLSQKLEKEILLLLQKKRWVTNLSAGISMPFYDTGELQIAYKQAYFAMTFNEEPGIRRCSDYALAFYIRLLRENDLSAHLRHPAISILRRYDAENHTDLLHTLDTYLKHNCSQNLTAGALHIHLNSLKYRLRRITELTDINYKNPENLFYLQLSLKI